MKETRINVCSYEMHEMELLDRALMSLQKTEEAYTDVNNRIIENVNQRKERLNNLNNRITAISQKILTLYGVNSAMRIVSPAHFPDVQKANNNKQCHPHQSIFYDHITYQDQAINAQHIPELSSIRLNKKLFNNRLKNNPEDLKRLVRGAKDDIQMISRLVKTLQHYRSQIGDFRGIINKQASNMNSKDTQSTGPEISQGLLGRIPEQTESIAELMLFDSDVNVYGDQNVYIEDFDARTRKMVAIPKAGKKFQQNYLQQQQQMRMRQKYKQGQKQNIMGLQEAPETLKKNGEHGQYNQLGYIPGENIAYTPSIATQAPTFQFANTVTGMQGVVADLDDHDNKVKELEQRRKTNQTMMNDTMMSMNPA